MAARQTLKYNTLDVFTTTPFEGNPLGLVHVEAQSRTPLTQAQKQNLAIEFNYSETVILEHPPPSWSTTATTTSSSAEEEPSALKQSEYHAQIFTPKSELPFAGHPTIGTLVWLFQNIETRRDELTLRLRAGQVVGRFDRESRRATAAIPHNVHVHEKTIAWDRVVASQPGLADGAGSRLLDAKMPVVSPVRGMQFVLVDLTGQPELLDRVVATRNDVGSVADLDAEWVTSATALVGSLFYRLLPDQNDGIVRVRQRMMAIDLEDPATGSASAALAAYLALGKGGAGETYRFELDQGVEMGRASKIFVAVTLKQDGKSVEAIELSGQAVEVMNGYVVV